VKPIATTEHITTFPPYSFQPDSYQLQINLCENDDDDDDDKHLVIKNKKHIICYSNMPKNVKSKDVTFNTQSQYGSK
jgi:hypothetical protein